MTTIFALKGLLNAAHDDLSMAKSMMLDNDCLEILGIVDSLNKLAELADKDGITAVPIGLYAVVYFLSGAAINIAKVTMPVCSYLERKPKRAAKTTGFTKAYKPIIRKLLACQELITYFADAVHKDCCCPLKHVSSQIMVLLEHPLVMQDDQIQKQLAELLGLIDELSERMCVIHLRFENHPLLKIDVSLISGGLVH